MRIPGPVTANATPAFARAKKTTRRRRATRLVFLALALSVVQAFAQTTITTGASVAVADPVTFTPGLITFAGNGTLSLTSSGILSNDITFNAGVAGTITTNVGIGLTNTLSGQLSGAGTFIKSGSGILVLTGTNTYTGGTTISGGVVDVGDGGTTGSIVGNVVHNDKVLRFNRSDDLTFAGNTSGTGAAEVWKLGGGVLTITGHLGSTRTAIAFGTLQVGNGGTTGSIGGNVLNYTNLKFNRSDDVTYAGVISESGAVTKLGAGILTLTGANTYTGATSISEGTLQIGNGGTTGSIAGNVVNNAVMTFNRSNDLTYAGVISGTGMLTKRGAGMLTLTGANTQTGGTTISTGTLQVGAGGTTGSLAGNVVNSGTLRFNRSNTVTYAGDISGTGALTKMGAGALVLTGTNTYTGGTTISGGLVDVGDGGTTGSIVGNVVHNDKVLRFNRSDDLTFAGNTSGTGAAEVWKLGGGVLTITGHLGSTRTAIAFGTLQVGNGGTTGSIGGNVLNYTNLKFNRSDDVTYSGVISESGAVTKLGAGMLTLTGANTYTGGTTLAQGTLAVAGNSKFGTGTLSITGGTLLGTANVTLPNALALSGSPTIAAKTATTLTVGGGGSSTAIGTALTIGTANATGTVLWAGNNGLGSSYSSITIAGGQLATVTGINLASGRTLNFTGNASILGNFTNNGAVSGTGGTLTFLNDVNGAGSFSGNVAFHAGYSPGNSPATVNHGGGDVTFDSTSLLTMEILGPTPGTQYDQLVGINTLSFNGRLSVVFGNGFAPTAGSNFRLFSFNTFVGSLAADRIDVTGFDRAQLDFSHLAQDGSFTVTAVPEPGTYAMFGAGLGLMGLMVRRRRGTRLIA